MHLTCPLSRTEVMTVPLHRVVGVISCLPSPGLLMEVTACRWLPPCESMPLRLPIRRNTLTTARPCLPAPYVHSSGCPCQSAQKPTASMPQLLKANPLKRTPGTLLHPQISSLEQTAETPASFCLSGGCCLCHSCTWPSCCLRGLCQARPAVSAHSCPARSAQSNLPIPPY